MEKEKQLFSLAFAKSTTLKFDWNVKVTVQPKSAVESENYRKKGNDLLLQQKKHDAETHKAILTHYSKSVALAPVASQELALAYGNRSYFLLHMQKYQDCIEDIDRALQLTICDELKAKLLCRKAECLKKLGYCNISSILKMVESLAAKIDGQDRIKLLKMIDTVKALGVDARKVGEKKRVNDYKLPLTDDYSSRVSIGYSEKYGRHLIAAKDYKPGDIIFVEEIYASVFQQGPSLLTCDYCMKPVWSSIPCDYCYWSMYCSESCKEKAWNKYHDIECSLISHLKEYPNFDWEYSGLPIRTLMTGIKETGSIADLKKAIDLLSQSDSPTKNLLKNGPFGINTIKNVYSLASYASDTYLSKLSEVVPVILIGLIKHSILKSDFNVEEIGDLLMNEDIKFLGSFLIKIMAVLNSNASGIMCDTFPDTRNKSQIVHCDDTRCLSILFSFINNSCFASADWRCIEQNKLIVFALQPIKKNSQIFISYRYGFEKKTLVTRQKKFLKQYNFTCDCQACVEGWPIINNLEAQQKFANDDINNFLMNGKFSKENMEKVRGVLMQGKKVDKSHIKQVSLSITQCRNWKQPLPMFSMLIEMLRAIFTAIYSPKSLLFDKCD